MISIPKGPLCALLISGILSTAPANPDSGPEEAPADEWAGLLQESEELLAWSEDPLADLLPEPAGAFTLWTVSIRAGGGSSSNFLKRAEPVSSPFAQLEGDLYLSHQLAHSSFTALAFFEAYHYRNADSAEREGVAFLHATQSFHQAARTITIEGEVFYGRQVFDASLLDSSPPEGDLFRQFRPRLAGLISLEIGASTLLKSGLALERVDFEGSRDDYWRPQLSGTWIRQWAQGVETHLEISAFGEWYDMQQPRSAMGIPLAGSGPVTVGGLRLESGMQWNRPEWHDLRIHFKAGLSREEANAGVYEDAWRLWGSFSGSFRFAWADLRLYARWQRSRFDHRFADLKAPPGLQQIYRTLKLELKRDLPWDLALHFGIEWNDFGSRASGDSFSERRARTLLEWTY